MCGCAGSAEIVQISSVVYVQDVYDIFPDFGLAHTVHLFHLTCARFLDLKTSELGGSAIIGEVTFVIA